MHLGARIRNKDYTNRKWTTDELDTLYAQLLALYPLLSKIRRFDKPMQWEDMSDEDFLIDGKHTALYLIGGVVNGSDIVEEVGRMEVDIALLQLTMPVAVLLRGGWIFRSRIPG
ncbi:hypothetical protein BJ508DRAFT_312547 [Ascobolus immersus RN42]|uniref:Uncharacterized protein n=1 Tax=Ascobolus immersus RN42 TaxID=1160509 RepID=A0A3N4HLQ8_ASCIM|nr:hypothetical protein BJ508DRAFT_312547 [Ascobolus immersus RN42]